MTRKIALLLMLCLLSGCTATALPEKQETAAPPRPSQQPTQPAEPQPPQEPAPPRGFFGAETETARRYLEELTDEDLAAQVCFARYPQDSAITQTLDAHPGGLLMFGRDFEGISMEKAQQKIAACQRSSPIPLLIGADEEGGTVCRISANPQLRPQRFPSPQQLKAQGGLAAVQADGEEKAALLKEIGVNVNLAPVADLCAPEDYMYPRIWGGTAAETADYVKTCVTALQNGGIGSVMKHFPGYAAAGNTHEDDVTDHRTLEELRQTALPPFAAGIEAGGEAILVSHHRVAALEEELPASLSPKVMQYLRGEMGFEGIIMTDDLAMSALRKWGEEGACAVRALNAGADLLIVSDFMSARQEISNALANGQLTRARLEEAALRVLCWKTKLGLLS